MSWNLDKLVVQYLKERYIFSEQEIKHNIDLFKEANKKIDLLRFLSENVRKAEKARNPKGWLIGAIKKHLEQLKERTEKMSEPQGGSGKVIANLAKMKSV